MLFRQNTLSETIRSNLYIYMALIMITWKSPSLKLKSTLKLEVLRLNLDFTLKLDHYKEKNYIVTLIRFRNIREINNFIVSLVIYSLKL